MKVRQLANNIIREMVTRNMKVAGTITNTVISCLIDFTFTRFNY